MENYNNPELKKSTYILVVIMSVFLILNYVMVKANNDKMKSEYIGVMGSITGEIIKSNPELEKHIVPIMTMELTEEDKQKGIAILAQYGLNEKVDDKYFPNINSTYRQNQFRIFILISSLFLMLLLVNYFQHVYYYKIIRYFNVAAKRIVEGDYSLKLSEEKEGDFSKFMKSFNSMGEVIRKNIDDLKKERTFLVDLLSDISHQLKTPLSSMILYNDILLNRSLKEEERKTFLEYTNNQLNRMQWLIQNLLKLARIDANAVNLEFEKLSLNETIEEAIEILYGKSKEAEVKIVLNQLHEVQLVHDRLWLQEALINIIKNAIEHTEADGTVNVIIEDSAVFIRVSINDSGSGISENDIVNIFKRFYKGKNTKKNESIGIGLSLAKSIIEKHGGYIEVKSIEGIGTTFVITFLKY